MAIIPRYYYNPRSHSCERFIYGGCQGNANNFETVDECKRSCMRDSELGRCNLPLKTGLCKAAIPRFFYNPRTHECERFTYGGCQGNANNFKTLEDCEVSSLEKCSKIAPEVRASIDKPLLFTNASDNAELTRGFFHSKEGIATATEN
ncbi:unnamed protein product [Porites lobata]|uniref:BPTI/Kunitz inhibitor domain-containing protein n=1 Tax=Porites lobata TaxID=104759 RepID=A0ABN8NTC8_9CNID|nr:unnamed protein product [Porites lobata]